MSVVFAGTGRFLSDVTTDMQSLFALGGASGGGSIACWVKPAVSGRQFYLTSRNGMAADGGWALVLDYASVGDRIEFQHGTSTSIFGDWRWSSAGLVYGAWNHLVITLGGLISDTPKAYVNGVALASPTVVQAPTGVRADGSTSGLRIAATGGALLGEIANIDYFGNAGGCILSPTEIAYLHRTRKFDVRLEKLVARYWLRGTPGAAVGTGTGSIKSAHGATLAGCTGGATMTLNASENYGEPILPFCFETGIRK